MLIDYLKYQGTIYLSEENLQVALKEDGATYGNHGLKQAESPTKKKKIIMLVIFVML